MNLKIKSLELPNDYDINKTIQVLRELGMKSNYQLRLEILI